MPATILKDPGTTASGELRRYAIDVLEDDWLAFAGLLEDLTGERVSVTVGDAVLSFENTRERLVWADACRQGVKSAANATVLIDWLEAWLHEQAQTDLMEKEAAARRVAICAEKMSPKTRDRGARLVKALESWRKS